MYRPEEIVSILLPEQKIKQGIKKLGASISRDYAGKCPILISVLKGSVIFLADLMRNISIPVNVDFIAVSSYGKKTETTGVVRMIMDLRENIYGRDVILVEDIVDTGLTMAYLIRNLSTRKPRSLKICALLDKPSNRKIKIKADYCGFTIANKFVVGYGLDYAEEYRNLPYVGVLKLGKGKKYE